MLPAPDLDDRRFQDLVNDAKRLVQQRCPEWTDHNVSDPGVTLIETFAFMVDQLVYRLNRVPDKLHIAFLDLLGLRLYPPTAASAEVTFWLSAPQTVDVVIPAGTEVATVRTEIDEAVVFATLEPLTVPSVTRSRVATDVGGETSDRTTVLERGKGFACFSDVPVVGESLYVGLSDPAPSCAVALRLECSVTGIGVDPTNPPLLWEAWVEGGWVACDLDRDETGGLNRPGSVVLHLPPGHVASVVAGHRGGWLRVRVVGAEEGQPAYTESPRVSAVTAFTVGGTTRAVHGEAVEDEVIGLSEGVPGQQFPLQHRPVVGGTELVVDVAAGAGWEPWTVVSSFAASGPDDRHVVLDAVQGEVLFGPAVREPDGTLTQHGAVPPKGAPMRVRTYRHGGGQRGNVSRGSLSVVKKALAGVARAENRVPAAGGVDAETLDEARDRAPVLLRTRDRAVTTEDYEHLAREAAPEVARVRCSPTDDDGAVRVLVVPAVADDDPQLGSLRFEQLVPDLAVLDRIAAHLDDRRCLGARVVVEPPVYQGITVVARLRARPRASADRVRDAALAALYRYFHALRGGPDGKGWPFGRPVHVGEVYGVLQRVDGVEFVEDARIFSADPITGTRGEQVQRVDVPPHALVFSFDHQLRVEQ
jgi:predicted phage baseplate assembly protein